MCSAERLRPLRPETDMLHRPFMGDRAGEMRARRKGDQIKPAAIPATLVPFMGRPFLRRRGHTPLARRQIQRRQSGRSVASRRRCSDRRNPPKRGWFGPSGRQVSQVAPPSLRRTDASEIQPVAAADIAEQHVADM